MGGRLRAWMGNAAARPMLVNMLREDPSAEAIDAASMIADEEIIVILGRIARTRPDLAMFAIAALRDVDDPRANAIVSALEAALSCAPNTLAER